MKIAPNLIHFLRKSVLVVFASGMASVIVFVRDAVIAARFGRGEIVDAYLLALVPVNQFMVMVGPALLPLLVPLILEYERNRSRQELRDVLASSLGIMTLTAIGLAVLIAVVGPLGLGFIGSELSAAGLDGAQRHLRLLSFLIVPGTISYFAWALLTTRSSPVLPNLGPALPSAVATISLLIFASSVGISSAIWGLLVGSMLTALVGLFAVRSVKPSLPHFNAFGWSRVASRRVASLIAIAAATSCASVGGALGEQAFAAQLGPGNVSTIAYANRIPLLVFTLGAAVSSSLLLPRFSKWDRSAYRMKRWEFRRLLMAAFLLTGITAVFLFFLSNFLVSLVFGRGAFSEQDVLEVASVERIYALSLPFFSAGIIGARLLNALGLHRSLLVITALQYAVDMGGCWILSGSFGAVGIAWAYVAMAVSYFGMILIRLQNVDRSLEKS